MEEVVIGMDGGTSDVDVDNIAHGYDDDEEKALGTAAAHLNVYRVGNTLVHVTRRDFGEM